MDKAKSKHDAKYQAHDNALNDAIALVNEYISMILHGNGLDLSQGTRYHVLDLSGNGQLVMRVTHKNVYVDWTSAPGKYGTHGKTMLIYQRALIFQSRTGLREIQHDNI